MTKVVLARLSPIVYDPRVYRIAKSLKKKYTILALGWNREKTPRNIVDNYITDLKLCNLSAPLGRSLLHSPRMLFSYIYYWTWLFIELIKARPDIVHSCDLDTAIPCYLYKCIFKKKMVFDIFDRYAMAFVPSKSKAYYSAVNMIEEFLSKHSDVLINVSEEALSTFSKRPKLCGVIMNCPEDSIIKERKKSADDTIMKIVYTGGILRKAHGLVNLVAAIKDIPGVELVLAGWHLKSDSFLEEILKVTNVRYMGLLEPAQALALETAADVMIALYEADLYWYTIMLPNKLFEAMMCGIPLVTNIAEKIVKEVDFGIIVEYDNIEEIKRAVVMLRDNPALRRKFGLNGRKAYLEKYNWSKMEEQLFKIYESLV